MHLASLFAWIRHKQVCASEVSGAGADGHLCQATRPGAGDPGHGARQCPRDGGLVLRVVSSQSVDLAKDSKEAGSWTAVRAP